MGKEPIAKLKDLKEDFEFDDPILNESLNITADFAKQLSNGVPSPKGMSKVSIFQRFGPPKSEEKSNN